MHRVHCTAVAVYHVKEEREASMCGGEIVDEKWKLSMEGALTTTSSSTVVGVPAVYIYVYT